MAHNDLVREGNLIRIRQWQLRDLKVWQNWHTGKQEWMDWDGPYFPKKTEQEIKGLVTQRINAIREGRIPNPPLSLVIADFETDELLGTVSRSWIHKEINWMANGLTIYDTRHRGKGIGFEALGLWNQFLLDTFPEVPRLDLRTWSGNHPMIGLAKKLGYREEARFLKAHVVRGKVYDGMGYGILREEWEAKYPKGFGWHLKGAN